MCNVYTRHVCHKTDNLMIVICQVYLGVFFQMMSWCSVRLTKAITCFRSKVLKKWLFWVKIQFFTIFLKNLTKMSTVTLKMYLQSRVRAQNERLFTLYQNPLENLTCIMCKGVKTAKNCPKSWNFDIFGDFGGPKWPYGRQILLKNDYWL